MGSFQMGGRLIRWKVKPKAEKKSPIYSNASKSKGGNRQNGRKQWRVRVREALWRRMANLGKGRRDSRSYCLRPWEPGKEERPNRHCSRLRLKKEKEKQREELRNVAAENPLQNPLTQDVAWARGQGFLFWWKESSGRVECNMVHVGLLLGSVGWKGPSQASPEQTRGRNRILLCL